MSGDDESSRGQVPSLFDLLGCGIVADDQATCVLAYTGSALQALNATHINLGSAVSEPDVPVLLFEPSAEIRSSRPDSTSREIQTEFIIMEGFNRLLPDSRIALLENWYATRNNDRYTLHDHRGFMWVSGETRADPDWGAAARRKRKVLVLYGTALGISQPPNELDTYRVGDRRAEFEKARQEGRIATAFVAWREAV
ncbi:hypothetical protein [Frankia sp. R43]|uniref:hypothetical protein n=1 Tax=Frankia sp. R43 TaxID=269536 RepID=UPI00128FC4E9|nr:hypothetical protein [Frankia sp. R43]